MEILLIEGRKSVGGGQIMSKHICNCLSEKNNISVFLPGDSTSPVAVLLSDYRQYYYKLMEFNRGEKNIADYFKFVYNSICVFVSLCRILSSKHFDLIYIQHQNVMPFVILANKFYGVPIVSHLHVYYCDGNARKLVNFCLKDHNVKKIIGVSNYTLSSLSNIQKQKSTVIYNLVDFNVSNNDVVWSENFAIAADIIESKGHKILLEALKFYKGKCKLHIIGNIIDRDLYLYLKENADNVELEFTGMIKDVSSYLIDRKICLVFVPSNAPFETFSLSMIEAWSLGIPTIATNDFGMKEIVETFLSNYKNNLLFKKNDSEDLLSKLYELRDNHELYCNLSLKLKDTVKSNFCIKQFKTRLIDVISDII